jgi:hypothetical protein
VPMKPQKCALIQQNLTFNMELSNRSIGFKSVPKTRSSYEMEDPSFGQTLPLHSEKIISPVVESAQLVHFKGNNWGINSARET